MKTEPFDRGKIVILGGGVTGLTLGWVLAATHHEKVVIVEREQETGGFAATFTQHRRSFDFGSHRLSFDIGSHRFHEKYDREVFALIKELCRDELLKRERNGLIFIKDRYLRYPPSSIDILFGFGIKDALRFLADFIAARLRNGRDTNREDNFESYIIRRIGKSLHDSFYKPYALKLWGMPPDRIDKEAAANRLSKFEPRALLKDMKRIFRRQGRDAYYYPKHGIGQLADEMKKRFLEHGGQLWRSAFAEKLRLRDDRVIETAVIRTEDGAAHEIAVDKLVSTIPLDAMFSLIRFEGENGEPPEFGLRWRGLRILYLITDKKLPSENETYYFPDPRMRIGRVSEINKYSPYLNLDHGKAALTAEIPCSPGDEVWNMDDVSLAQVCIEELERMKILGPGAAEDAEYFSRKIRSVYPVYELRWQEKFRSVRDRLKRVENLYLIGRSALFLHCNIDHCMHMALRLAEFLARGDGDREEWAAIENSFFKFKVRE